MAKKNNTTKILTIAAVATGSYLLFKDPINKALGISISGKSAGMDGRKVFDSAQVKNVSVANLNFNGKQAGKVVSVWSNSGACMTSIVAYDGPLKQIQFDRSAEKATGYGYDKVSQNVYLILMNNGITPKLVSSGNGRTREEFEAWGYTYDQLI